MNEQVLNNAAAELYDQRAKSGERAYLESQLLQVEPGLARRLLWQVGELFVRGGQWLQERFCVEPACAPSATEA